MNRKWGMLVSLSLASQKGTKVSAYLQSANQQPSECFPKSFPDIIILNKLLFPNLNVWVFLTVELTMWSVSTK